MFRVVTLKPFKPGSGSGGASKQDGNSLATQKLSLHVKPVLSKAVVLGSPLPQASHNSNNNNVAIPSTKETDIVQSLSSKANASTVSPATEPTMKRKLEIINYAPPPKKYDYANSFVQPKFSCFDIDDIVEVPFDWNLVGILNWGNLYSKVLTKISEVYRLCFSLNLLPNKMNCENCDHECRLSFRTTARDIPYLIFVCYKCKRKENSSLIRSLTKGTMFQKSKLTIGQVLGLAYWFVYGNGSCDEAIRECSFHNPLQWITVATYYEYFREVCCRKVREETYIGGPNCTVEVHEFEYAREQCKQRLVSKLIIGVCRESAEVFIIENKDGTVKTLLRTIIQFVQPYTTIVMNCSKFLENLMEEEWEIMTAGTNLKFKDQKFITDFQNCNGVWADLKRTLLKKRRKKLDTSLGMYSWKKKYTKMNLNLYKLFLQHISEVQKYNTGLRKI